MDMQMIKQNADKVIEIVKSNKTIAKYIKTDYWISGSSTYVYPITTWLTTLEFPHIEIQLENNAKERYLRKAIEKIKNENKDIIRYMYFCKYDGSCPDIIRIVLGTNNK